MKLRHPAHPRALLSILVLACLLCASWGCSDSSSNSGKRRAAAAFSGKVAGVAGEAVVGATVYLVPVEAIDMTEITASGVLAGTTEPYDEPLEDAVAAGGATFANVPTNAAGGFSFPSVAAGRYYVLVLPGAGDTEHLPGGSMSRESKDAVELRGTSVTILVSSSPSAAATYVGMSSCLVCHPDYDTEETLAHRLGFRVPGVSSPLQDTSEHPEIDDGLAFFLDAAVHTDGTPLYYYDYDASRGFDKFRVALEDPAPGGATVSAILWLWRDTADSTYKITIENVGNLLDMGSPATRDVELTYGGAVYKQRYMIRWPGRNGRYPLAQYQTTGSDDIYDRTRNQFRDYHLDFYWDNGGTPTDVTDDVIADPSLTRNIERNCMGCHAVGFTQFIDPVTTEVMCDSIEDPNGEFDIDGDGFINDINTGCESCHGPGSEHVAGAGADGRWLVQPEYLTASREVQMCGRCHNRQVGQGMVMNDHPLNSANEFPPPGISRAEYLTDYVSRKGPAQGSFWPDFEHSKSHHQQAPDFIKSQHYRNDRQLVTCWDCHDMHGGTGHQHGLVEDPDEPESPLCMNCHEPEIVSTNVHTAETLGVVHGAFTAHCVDCHMPKTAKTGAGEYGYLLAPPTGMAADADTAYFENDVTSHIFDVIPKSNVGVQGVQPIKAMPIPYTNACGVCHDPSGLPF